VSTDPLAALAALAGLPGVAAAAERARAAVDRALGQAALGQAGFRRGRATASAGPDTSAGAALAGESVVRGARASAALDGHPYPLTDVRAGPPSDPVLQGALRATAAAVPSAATWRRAPRQVLARLHGLAAADLLPAAELGRPKGRVGTAERLDQLAALAVAGGPVPAVLLAAVVHGELLALAPFVAANGLVARAAARVVAVAAGLDPYGLCVPEVGHLELASEYGSAAAMYAAGQPDGVAAWLRHCCVAIELGAREALAVGEALTRR